MAFEPWTRVKYLCDNQPDTVPVNDFFLDHATVVKELENGDPQRNYYYVFWSPINNDTPTKLKKREGKILHQDGSNKVKLLVGDGKKPKSVPTPQGGWYKATLLQWEGKRIVLERGLSERKPSSNKIE